MINTKVKRISIAIMLVGIIFLSCGYAALSNNMSIEGMFAKVKLDVDIKIISNVVKETSPGVQTTYSEYTSNKTLNGVVLPQMDSYIIIDVGILNLGNAEMGIKNLLEINENLKYEIVNNDFVNNGYAHYQEKEKLCDDNDSSKCILGSETHVLVKISYKDENSYNSSETKTFDVNLKYDFRRVYRVKYTKKAEQLITSDPVNYAIEGDNFSIGFNFLDIDYVSVQSSYELVANVDYTLNNNILTINDVKDAVTIGVNYDKYGSMTIASRWVTNNSVEITLNGTATQAFYIRLRDGDLYIATSAKDLKNPTYNSEPLFGGKDIIYQEFEYLDGTCNLVAAITIKFRDTSEGCNAMDIAQFITHHSSKNNFNEYDTYAKSGPAYTNGVSLSQLSFYTSAGNVFNNYKFRITYGKTN